MRNIVQYADGLAYSSQQINEILLLRKQFDAMSNDVRS